MRRKARSVTTRYTPQSLLDTRNDKRTRTVVFFLRLLAIVFFVPLYAGVPLTFRFREDFDPVHLWEIGLGGVPWIGSFLLIGAAVYLVVILHEAVHAAVITLFGGAPASISIDGITPRAHSESAYMTRPIAFFVTVAPFFLGSLVGVGALIIVPDQRVSWAFLPTVANAVVSASDFVVVAWLVSTPRASRISVLIDGCVAYKDNQPEQNGSANSD